MYNMKYIGILFVLLTSLVINGMFIFSEVKENQIKKEQALKELFTEKLFSEWQKLKDYSNVKYTLDEEGKSIIKNAREFHSSPAIIKGEWYDKYLCAWFLFELSSKLWGNVAPFTIGMMEQKTKTPADAWQLPDSYRYVGGEIMEDFSGKFSLEKKDFWETVNITDLKNFFHTSFSEEALLWDIGFLYKDTDYISELKKTWNSNSHIVKNIGVSDFKSVVQGDVTSKTNLEVFSETLSCDVNIFPKMKDLLTHYELYHDGKRIVYTKGDFFYLSQEWELLEKVVFKQMSEITIKDITLIHFFQWAQVDSLFKLICNWKFYPINIMSINPRFIEKM